LSPEISINLKMIACSNCHKY